MIDREEALCSVCAGQPLASGSPCICGGEGTEIAEMRGLRLEVERLRSERHAISQALSEHPGVDDDGSIVGAVKAMGESLRLRTEEVQAVEQNRWCIVPPNQETPDWSIFEKFDGEFGYENELATGPTLTEAIAAAIVEKHRRQQP